MKHHCHWPGCEKEVPPRMWGCVGHWKALPADLQRRIWATYVPGQEITKRPSPEYLAVATEVQRWCRDHIAKQAAAKKPPPQEALF